MADNIENDVTNTVPVDVTSTTVDTTTAPVVPSKQITPSIDKDNYLIQVTVDGKVIKQVIALNSCVNIVLIGEQSLSAEIK